jgi:hypothetical protein
MADNVLMPYPRFRAFDSNGDPLAGGKVYFWEAGDDSTPKDTYATYDLSTPNANPVILDAQGYADIWGSGAYWVEIYTSGDVLVSSTDNIEINTFEDSRLSISLGGITIQGQGGNTVIGSYGVAIGGSNNSVETNATYGWVYGKEAVASLHGEHATAIGKITTAGDIQKSDLCFKGFTSDATPKEIFTDGASKRLTIPTDCTYLFKAYLVARRTDADNESAAYEFFGCIDNNAGTTALVGSVQTGTPIEDTAGWAAAFTADNTNDALVLTVTGAAASTVWWFCDITIVKIKG